MRRLLALLILLAAPAWAATYYVKNGGSDAATGLSDALAWETIAKVNGSSFSPGDSILFKKDSTWREQLTVPSSGTNGSPIMFGAYGTGADPIILGSINKDAAEDWTEDEVPGGYSTVETFTETGSAADFRYGSNVIGSGNEWVATASFSVTRVICQVYKHGTVTGNIWVEVWDSATSAPNAKIGQSDSVSLVGLADNPGAVTNFDFSTPVALTNSSTYYFILSGDCAVDWSNYVGGMGTWDTATPYPRMWTHTATWASATTHMFYMIIQETLATLDLWYWTYSTAPNMGWRDGVPMTWVATQAACDAVGKLWLDTGNTRLYTYCDGAAPTVGSHTFEFPQRDATIRIATKHYITVDGLECAYSNSYDLWVSSSNYLTVTNCNINRPYLSGVYLNSGSNATITYNDVSYTGHSSNVPTLDHAGIALTESGVGPAAHLVAHNHVSHTGRSGICLYDSGTSGSTVEYNKIHDTAENPNDVGDAHKLGYGIQIYNSSPNENLLSNTIIRYNYVYDTAMASFVLFNTTDTTAVYGNIFSNAGNTGGYAADYKTNFYIDTSTNLVIYNNVFYQPAGTGTWTNIRVIAGTSMEGAIIKNNIFYNGRSAAGSYTYQCDVAHTSDPTFDYNLHYSAMGGAFLKIENAEQTWATRGAGFEDAGVNADPLFTNAAGGDFTLAAGSPCIDAGVDLGSTYQLGLMPASSWPASVLTGSQYNAGQKWEGGAYLFPNKRQSLIIVGK